MFRSAALTLTLCLATVTAQGALLGRAALTPGGTDYQAYYDDVLNITWQANAGLAESETFGLPVQPSVLPETGSIGLYGLMNWYTASMWIEAMNNSNYLGYADWRLPRDVQPDPSCQFVYDPKEGDPDSELPAYGGGEGCTAGEMAHLSNVDGIVLGYSPLFALPSSDHGFWTSYTVPHSPVYATFVWLVSGTGQAGGSKIVGLNVLAVRDGDIAVVPVPAAVWLFGSALGVMGWMRRQAG